jgi:hypothetical protein
MPSKKSLLTILLLMTAQTAFAQAWINYDSANFPFTLSYPHGSSIEVSSGGTYKYLRIEKRSKPDQESWLAIPKADFYLEVFFFDDNQKNILDQCPGLKPIKAAPYRVNKAWRGILAEENPDRGGIPFALCLDNSKWTALAVATESSRRGITTKRILDSFRAK